MVTMYTSCCVCESIHGVCLFLYMSLSTKLAFPPLLSSTGYDVSCVDSDSTSDGGSASIGTTVGYGCPHIR